MTRSRREPKAIQLYGIPTEAKQANEDAYFGVSMGRPNHGELAQLGALWGPAATVAITPNLHPAGIPQYEDSTTYSPCALQTDPNWLILDYLGAPVTISGPTDIPSAARRNLIP